MHYQNKTKINHTIRLMFKKTGTYNTWGKVISFNERQKEELTFFMDIQKRKNQRRNKYIKNRE